MNKYLKNLINKTEGNKYTNDTLNFQMLFENKDSFNKEETISNGYTYKYYDQSCKAMATRFTVPRVENNPKNKEDSEEIMKTFQEMFNIKITKYNGRKILAKFISIYVLYFNICKICMEISDIKNRIDYVTSFCMLDTFMNDFQLIASYDKNDIPYYRKYNNEDGELTLLARDMKSIIDKDIEDAQQEAAMLDTLYYNFKQASTPEEQKGYLNDLMDTFLEHFPPIRLKYI